MWTLVVSLFHGVVGQDEVFNSLLMEGNELLDRFMAENGLDLLSTTINLADIDEIVSATNQHKLDSSLDFISAASPSPEYNQLGSPASVSTYPDGSASPSQQIGQGCTDEPELLSSLLQSLIEDDPQSESASPWDSGLSSPEADLFLESPASCDSSGSLDLLDARLEYAPKVIGEARGKRKSKSTPYSKLPAGRKERKKKQNKEAAIRYREKKKNEAVQSANIEALLSDRNKSLKTEVLNLEREIMCMKELLSDVFNIHSL